MNFPQIYYNVLVDRPLSRKMTSDYGPLRDGLHQMVEIVPRHVFARLQKD